MRVYNETIDHHLELPERPQRIVCLSSGFSEALFAIGAGERVVGVSAYCDRYVDIGRIPVVGDYLKVDYAALDAVDPDLIIVTTGVQRGLATALKSKGYPVYALPLPESLPGIADAVIRLGALTGTVVAARALAWDLGVQAQRIHAAWDGPQPRVYVELWFGKFARTIGARSYIHDIVTIAGGRPLFADRPESYIEPPATVGDEQPDLVLGFYEPEYVVDFAQRIKTQGWRNAAGGLPGLVVSDIQKGRNLIHDGPSLIATAAWLQDQMRRQLARA